MTGARDERIAEDSDHTSVMAKTPYPCEKAVVLYMKARPLTTFT